MPSLCRHGHPPVAFITIQTRLITIQTRQDLAPELLEDVAKPQCIDVGPVVLCGTEDRVWVCNRSDMAVVPWTHWVYSIPPRMMCIYTKVALVRSNMPRFSKSGGCNRAYCVQGRRGTEEEREKE